MATLKDILKSQSESQRFIQNNYIRNSNFFQINNSRFLTNNSYQPYIAATSAPNYVSRPRNSQ